MCSKICSWKVCAACSGCNALLFLFAGIFAFSALQGVIQNQAIQQVRMSSQTYGLWGQVPGELGANISRYYTFYNFTNPYETVYLNQTPKFVLMESNLYQEYQYFLKPNFTDIDSDGELDVVEYYYYDYVLPNNVVPNQTITTVNLGPMGFWYNVKTAPPAQLSVSILALLIQSIQSQILSTVYSTGVFYISLGGSFDSYNRTIGILLGDPQLISNVWNDPVYGMGNPNTFAAWVAAVLDGINSGAAELLMDYFGIPYNVMLQLLSDKPESEGDLFKYINGIKSSVPTMYPCPNGVCSKEYMAALQWSSQGVTMTNQQGIPPQPSITSANNTASGYPEISYFLNSYLIPLKSLPPEFKVVFTTDLALQLLNFTPDEGSKYCTKANTLLNIGNLNFLFKIGEEFDNSNPELTNLTMLTPIMDRFNLPTLQHAYIVYEYVKYMYSEFGEQQSLGGDASILMLGNSFSQVLYQLFVTMQSYLVPELTSQQIWSNYQANGYTCETLFNETFDGNEELANLTCSLPKLSPFDIESVRYLYFACYSPATPNYEELNKVLNFSTTPMNYVNLCTDPANGFSSFLLEAISNLQQHYNCSTNTISNSCSFYELAVKQWTSSQITQNPPAGVNFPKSNSVYDWNSTLFPEPFEYIAVLNDSLPGALPGYKTIDPIPEEIGYSLLNFNSLFNGVVSGNVFIYSQNPNMSQKYNETFYGLDAFLLKTYMRYIFLEIFMGGFAQTRPTVDLLWGYRDPLLTLISQLSPLGGGDPAVNPIIALSGGNMSYEQAFESRYFMYTGYGNIDQLRMYISCYGKPYIAANVSEFDGNKTVSKWINPWKEEIPIYGTDSMLNKPGLDETYEPPIFINSIFFQTNVTYQNQRPNYYGLEALRFGIPQSAMASYLNNPYNSRWYMDKWNGLLNFTSVQKAPVFFSKNNFLNCDQEIIDSVELYYDAQMTQPIVPTSADDTFVDLEPTTGATLGSTVRLQLNYEFQNDSLFNVPTYAMLPLFNLQRGSNFTEEQVSSTYGPLIIGLTIVQVGPIVSYILFGILSVLAGISIFKLRQKNIGILRNVRQQEIEGSLNVVDNPENSHNLMVIGTEEQRLGDHLLQGITETGPGPQVAVTEIRQ